MYAIVKTGGKQYKVQEGDIVFIEKLSEEEGVEITFNEVLAISSGDTVSFGAPLIDGATVSGKVLNHGKSKKIIVFKYKPKKGYRKKQGHRQSYTKVQIEKINVCWLGYFIMIEIDIFRDKQSFIKEFTVKGHAEFDEKGKDIVCAAISAIAYTAVGAIEEIVGISDYSEQNGFMKCSVPLDISSDKRFITGIILETTAIGFKQIEYSYKDYVSVFDKEV